MNLPVVTVRKYNQDATLILDIVEKHMPMYMIIQISKARWKLDYMSVDYAELHIDRGSWTVEDYKDYIDEMDYRRLIKTIFRGFK